MHTVRRLIFFMITPPRGDRCRCNRLHSQYHCRSGACREDSARRAGCGGEDSREHWIDNRGCSSSVDQNVIRMWRRVFEMADNVKSYEKIIRMLGKKEATIMTMGSTPLPYISVSPLLRKVR